MKGIPADDFPELPIVESEFAVQIEEKKLRSLEKSQDMLRVAAPRVIHKVTEEEKQDELAKFLERTTKRYGLNQPKKPEGTI